jgi:hypothetical protein
MGRRWIGMLLVVPLLVSARGATPQDLRSMVIHLGQGDVSALVGDTITVLFNPKEFSITKSTPWQHHDVAGKDSPTLEFTSGEPYRCTFELFFNTYEDGTSVKVLTDQIEKLAQVIPNRHRPPVVPLTWGGKTWGGTLLAAQTQFVDFDQDGTPLAAVMNTLWSDFVLIDLGDDDPDDPTSPVTLQTPAGNLDARVTLDSIKLRRRDTIHRMVPNSLRGPTPKLDLDSDDPAQLSLELILEDPNDVRDLAQRVKELTLIDPDLNRPPTVRLNFGKLSPEVFLVSFTLRFKIFLEDGTPSRATVETHWREVEPPVGDPQGPPRR